jgi:hypothetical protein
MLQRGDQVPHFAVTTIGGSRVEYSRIWQRRNLVLMRVPDEPSLEPFQEYAAQLAARVREVAGDDTECVITSDSIPRTPAPGVVLADRWGEIYFSAASSTVEGLPRHGEVLECIRSIQHECPECQGEAR